MDDKEIEKKIKEIVSEQLGIDAAQIQLDSSFVDDLGADSLDTVELVMRIEDEYACEVPDEEAEKITTVQKAIHYVKEHVKKHGNPKKT